MTDFFTVLAPDPSTTEPRTTQDDSPTIPGAPVIYDNPPAGRTQTLEPVNADDVWPPSYRATPHEQVPPAPAPIIFTVPIGGIALDAGTIVNQAATTNVVTIGAASEGRPDVIGILVYCAAGVGTAEILKNADGTASLNTGFLLPVFAAGQVPIFIPLKRANVRLIGAVSFAYVVIASGLSQGR